MSDSSRGDFTTLGMRYGTDKCSAQSYTGIYDRCFSHLRDEPIRFFEIGVGGYEETDKGGESMRMWRDYFPNAKLASLDYFPKTCLDDLDVEVFQGAQADLKTLTKVIDHFDGALDIIIDDGSHRSEDVIFTFQALFPYLSVGGFYVVEDSQTSYFPNHGGSIVPGAPSTMMTYFRNLVDGLNWRELHSPHYSPTIMDVGIVSLTFRHNLIIVEKGLNNEESNILRNNVFPESWR